MQIVTANDLLAGDVVFLTAAAAWSRDISAAAVAESQAAAERLLAKAEADTGRIVGPYLADVERGQDGAPQPTHYRERIRLCGPTNRTDLGRQSEAPAVRREGA